jgi:uroporphyrinogen-III synthase
VRDMASSHAPLVVLFSAEGTLAHIDRPLHREGVRLTRISSIVTRPIAPTDWIQRLARAPTPDTVVVTSRTAVRSGLLPWRRALGRLPRELEFWAVGPGTTQALRDAHIRQIHRPQTVSAAAVARALGRRARRAIVYFRSDAAGPRLARALRNQGHSVTDLVVYRLELPSRLTRRAQQALAKADLLVVTSPSALARLRQCLDRRTFTHLARTARLIVLGERSRIAARRIGLRRVAVAPSTSAQRFTRFLLRELRDGPA